jgi:hypothetical protein
MFSIEFFSRSTSRIVIFYFRIKNLKNREKVNKNMMLKDIILKKKVKFILIRDWRIHLKLNRLEKNSNGKNISSKSALKTISNFVDVAVVTFISKENHLSIISNLDHFSKIVFCIIITIKFDLMINFL